LVGSATGWLTDWLTDWLSLDASAAQGRLSVERQNRIFDDSKPWDFSRPASFGVVHHKQTHAGVAQFFCQPSVGR